MTTPSDQRPEGWKPVSPMDGCTFSGYQASDQGRYRSVDRVVKERSYRGQMLATRLDTDGYVLINLRCDSTDPDHDRRHTFLGHRVTLTTFDKACPPGMEACHSDRGPAFNWWPEGIRWDTKPANEADKPFSPGPPEPQYPCLNAPLCANLVIHEGRRCRDCVTAVGREAAQLLRRGVNLMDVAQRYGYTGPDWVWKLARDHGGYEGTKAQALAQHPSRVQRLRLRLAR